VARTTQRFGSAGAGGDGEYDLERRREIGAPCGGHRQGAAAWKCANPSPNDITFEHERCTRAAPVVRPTTFGTQWTMCDANARYAQRRTEMQCKPRTTGMIAASRVYQQHVGEARQRAHGRFEHRSLAQGKQRDPVWGRGAPNAHGDHFA
jgi:hypothetical protein